MTTPVNHNKILRGTTAKVKAYTGPAGELVFDTERRTLFIQDGLTPGGVPVKGAGKNYVVDGDFNHWDEAASQTASGYGSSTMWRHLHNGSTKTVSRQAFTLGDLSVPGNLRYFCRTVVNTAPAGDGNYVSMSHHIESVRSLAGSTALLLLWARSETSGNMAVEFRQKFGGASPAVVSGIGSALLSLTPTWQKFSIFVDIPSISGKTIDSLGNDNLSLVFWFDAGATYSAQAAGLGRQTGTFDIARVRLTNSDSHGDFIDYSRYDEIPRVGRYYQKGRTGLFNSYVSSGQTYLSSTFLPFPLRDYTAAQVSLVNATNLDFPATVGTPTLLSPDLFSEYRAASATSATGRFSSNYTIDNRLV